MVRFLTVSCIVVAIGLGLPGLMGGCTPNGNDPTPGNGNGNDNTVNPSPNDNGNDNIVDPSPNDNGNDNVEPTGPFTLTLDLVGEGAGTVTLDPPEGPYEAGTVVQLTAAAAQTYAFAGFSGDLNSTESTATVTVNSDKTVVATFVGNLFAGVFNRDRVFQFDGTTGELLSQWFDQIGELQGPIGVAFRSNGNLLVVSRITNEILEYESPKGRLLGAFASDPQFASPRLMTFGPNGNLFVTDSTNNVVAEFEADTGDYLGAFADEGLDLPRGLVFREDGNLFVVNRGSGNVSEFDGTTGEFLGIFTSGGELSRPHGLVFNPAGNLLVASRETGNVVEYDGQSGEFVGVFIEQDEETLMEPVELVVGPNGNLFVSDRLLNAVVEFDAVTGEFVQFFATSEEIDFPTGLVFKPLP